MYNLKSLEGLKFEWSWQRKLLRLMNLTRLTKQTAIRSLLSLFALML